jgi:hypothetical protein
LLDRLDCSKKKKKPLILFELLIALSLTAILLTFLFSFFVESAKLEKKLEKARIAINERSYLQTRLQNVLCLVDQGSISPYFYTKVFEKEKQLSLVTIFDNGIDPDPLFSGPINGRVFMDEEKNLCLSLWPLEEEKKGMWRKEILLSSIDAFEFEFLGKKSAIEHGEKEKIRPLTASLCWRTGWSRSFNTIPSMIRLTVKQGKETLRFAFILPTQDLFVTYQPESIL